MKGYWIPFFLLLTSCGYHFGQGSLPSKYQTITVPYISGDKTGEMTAALTKELSKSGAFIYHRDCADLFLNVTIVDYYEENIGYRHNIDKNDKRTHSIIPTETRMTALAEVVVVESCSGCIVLGPARITASVDFDHDYYFSPDGINAFSLGQLTDAEAARDAVMRPLSHALAEKVVDYVVHSW